MGRIILARSVLVWNIHFYHKMAALAFFKAGASYRGAFLGLNAQCFRPNDPACKYIISIPDQLQNVSNAGSFLDAGTALDRESRPEPYRDPPAVGSSNIYVSRVSIRVQGPAGLVFTTQ